MGYKKEFDMRVMVINQMIDEDQTKHENCCLICRNSRKNLFEGMRDIVLIPKIKKDLRRNKKEYDVFKQSECEDCGIDYNLHVHHKDGDYLNNDSSNLQTLCGNCHCKTHWGKNGTG